MVAGHDAPAWRWNPMKKFPLIAVLLVSFALFAYVSRPMAQDLTEGQKVFDGFCSGCHSGGGNKVNPKKTLQMSALEKYGMNSVEAIKKKVTKGNGMPSFESRLNAEQIENVAAYVLDKARKGW
jgi:cytochrome c6